MSYSLLPNQSFSIKQNTLLNRVNALPPSSVERAVQVNLGATGVAIPPTFIPGGYLFMSPFTGATGPVVTVPNGQIYTLPTAATLLSELGEPLGVSQIVPGEVIVLTAVNRGTFPAYIVGSTGTDGTFVEVPAPVILTGATGSVVPLGTGLRFAIEFTSVSPGSVNGNNNIGTITLSTGAYTLYHL
jgi:hypothetical protein